MDAHTIGVLLLGGAGLGAVVWALHKIGKALITVMETLAAMAVVFVALWWFLKAVVWLFTQVVTSWRTSLALLALAAWWHSWGWPSPALTLGVITVVLVVWRWIDVRSFDTWAGRTEYGQDWFVPLTGQASHTLIAGASGAGKNSLMWCPLVSIAPAIRDGLVRISGIDPKGMELAYGRGIFHRYAVTGTEALSVLDELVGAMATRKTKFAGQVRSVPISREYPLELLEFDEIGALTKYTDRKTREAITERVALLTTQGRALGITVRGYVQEPTKDTVPVRELFPRRICLRVTAKSHVGMVLGDQAYERGAWANRISESEPGVGYVFGEGIREPLRIRAGWVPDQMIKHLETFTTHHGTVLPLPAGTQTGVAA